MTHMGRFPQDRNFACFGSVFKNFEERLWPNWYATFSNCCEKIMPTALHYHTTNPPPKNFSALHCTELHANIALHTSIWPVQYFREVQCSAVQSSLLVWVKHWYLLQWQEKILWKCVLLICWSVFWIWYSVLLLLLLIYTCDFNILEFVATINC